MSPEECNSALHRLIPFATMEEVKKAEYLIAKLVLGGARIDLGHLQSNLLKQIGRRRKPFKSEVERFFIRLSNGDKFEELLSKQFNFDVEEVTYVPSSLPINRRGKKRKGSNKGFRSSKHPDEQNDINSWIRTAIENKEMNDRKKEGTTVYEENPVTITDTQDTYQPEDPNPIRQK